MAATIGVIVLACLVIIFLKELVFEAEGSNASNIYKPMNLAILVLTSLFIGLFILLIIEILVKR